MKRLYQARKVLGLTQKQMADIMQIGQNAYSMIENNKINLTDRNKAILSEKLLINPLWLLNGIGEMFLFNKNETPTSLPNTEELAMRQPHTEPVERGVPLFDKSLTSTSSDRLIDTINSEREYSVSIPTMSDCTLFRTVYGESMSPRYNPSDIIALKHITDHNLILYGEAYLCVIEQGSDVYETLKILRKHPDPKMITLKPTNEMFDETSIPLSHIRHLFIVKGKIERNL